MKKSIKWVALVIIAAIIIYFIKPSLFGADGGEGGTPLMNAAAAPGKIPVSGIIVNSKTIDDKINVTGSITPNESVEIKSEIAGLIKRIHFQEGSKVNKGQLLIDINDDELSAQLEKIQHQKKLVTDNEYRQQQLLEKEAISQEEYEIALTELKSVEADLRILKAQLAKTKIRAPFTGTIGLRYISEGSYVSPNQQIASLVNNNPVKIDFSIPGKYSDKVKVDDKIRFTTEALPEFREGKIYAIEPRVDPNTRTLKLRAITPNENYALIPGQFTRIELVFNSYDNTIMIPTEAVIPELGGHKVFVQKDGKAQSQEITIGLRTESEIEVVNGLVQSDTLITSGVLQLRPGVAVAVTLTN